MTDAIDEGAKLKVFSDDEIAEHRTTQSCWLVINGLVYDVTSFLARHPGGSDVVLQSGGRNATTDFQTDRVHEHSRAAHAILRKFKIGKIANYKARPEVFGVSGAEAERLAKLVNMELPLLPQVLRLDDAYQPWVHHTYGHTTLRLFESDFFESLSFHVWWYIFFMWVPVVAYLLYGTVRDGMHVAAIAAMFALGMFTWTLVEYVLHRFFFHMPSSGPVGNFVHFFAHGIHHLTPMEPSRLTFPPTFAPVIGGALYLFFTTLVPGPPGRALFAGGIFMYMMYDTMHYLFHHSELNWSYFRRMKKRHLDHHFVDDSSNFGVTCPLWDHVFGTAA